MTELDPTGPALPDGAIAVIGMAVRVPGAADVAAFWDNLIAGVESVTVQSIDGARIVAAGVLDDADRFDAALFGYTAAEAAELDPQQRVFLECAWSALEAAGYPPGAPLRAGVYAGASFSSYLLTNLLPAMRDGGLPASTLGFAGDFVATRVAYKLGLTGPALTVQTACSTSLVAIHLACQALIAGECELALAGGVRITSPQLVPYVHHAGSILSADGHCRAFDAHSTGTVPGNGCGVVVLKRLADAMADGDPIRAIVLGTAINNDGRAKAGFAAPSVDGQAAAIREAHAIAGVAPGDIGYIEAHGTATPLGDPIEVAALRQVFDGVAPGACGLGTVKSNLGHLDAAAGVVGFIKAALALEHRALPPSLHFTAPNPQLELDGSPFYVVAERRDWAGPGPRRAGVSAFGIGGTNAHVVLQEPPARPRSASAGDQLVVLSARTRGSLDAMAGDLAAWLDRAPGAALADVAHTLQVGRARHAVRRYAVGRDPAAIAEALRQPGDAQAQVPVDDPAPRDAVLAFPGGGVQRVDMAAALRDEPAYRAAFDDCAARVAGLIDVDLRRVVYPAAADAEAMARVLDAPLVSQAAVFACDWAIARQWQAWGVTPAALVGHSLGEYAAACVAGVMSLDDALRLVVARGRIFERLPASGMMSVLAPAARLEPWLGGDLAVAAINGPGSCVVGGPLDRLDALVAALQHAGLEHRRLRYARAAHSPLLEPHLDGFEREVRRCALQAPRIRIASSLTGGWLTAAEATDPAYWRRQLREPVQFGRAVATVVTSGRRTVIEAGPAATLTALIRQHPDAAGTPVVATIAPGEPRPALAALGEAWVAGVAIAWPRGAQRIALPTYRFERARHWIEPAGAAPIATPIATAPVTAGSGDTERAVLACYRALFRDDRLGPHDDFFRLGGDSLHAVRLAGLIADRLGQAVSLQAITEAPSAAALAARLGGTAATAPRGLVQLQAGRTPAVFLIHGLGGHVMSYRALAAAIDPARAMYGIEAAGVDLDGDGDGDARLPDSIEAMARAYVARIRAAQPTGPYLLVGGSFGGTVAYEMARQLAAAGQAVPLCAMLDAPGPGALPELARDVDALAGELPPDAHGRRLRAVWHNSARLLARYAAPAWPDGEVQFFAPRAPHPRLPADLAHAWLGRCAVRVEHVAGDHFTMSAAPDATALGARIRRCLDRALQPS